MPENPSIYLAALFSKVKYLKENGRNPESSPFEGKLEEFQISYIKPFPAANCLESEEMYWVVFPGIQNVTCKHSVSGRNMKPTWKWNEIFNYYVARLIVYTVDISSNFKRQFRDSWYSPLILISIRIQYNLTIYSNIKHIISSIFVNSVFTR